MSGRILYGITFVAGLVIGSSGWSAPRALEQIRDVPALRTTPVIVISSIYSDHPVFSVSPGSGWLPADLFLPKPIDPARLLAESARLMAPDYAGRDASVEGSNLR